MHEISVLDVDGDIKSGLAELAEGMNISTVFNQQLCDVVMAMLSCPVKSRHLQHIFGVDVGSTLKHGGNRWSTNYSFSVLKWSQCKRSIVLPGLINPRWPRGLLWPPCAAGSCPLLFVHLCWHPPSAGPQRWSNDHAELLNVMETFQAAKIKWCVKRPDRFNTEFKYGFETKFD